MALDAPDVPSNPCQRAHSCTSRQDTPGALFWLQTAWRAPQQQAVDQQERQRDGFQAETAAMRWQLQPTRRAAAMQQEEKIYAHRQNVLRMGEHAEAYSSRMQNGFASRGQNMANELQAEMKEREQNQALHGEQQTEMLAQKMQGAPMDFRRNEKQLVANGIQSMSHGEGIWARQAAELRAEEAEMGAPQGFDLARARAGLAPLRQVQGPGLAGLAGMAGAAAAPAAAEMEDEDEDGKLDEEAHLAATQAYDVQGLALGPKPVAPNPHVVRYIVPIPSFEFWPLKPRPGDIPHLILEVGKT